MKNFFKIKKFLLQSHTGFKGIWLVNILNYLGANVYGFSKKDKFIRNYKKLCSIKKGKDFFGDILNKKLMRSFKESQT